MVEQDSQNTWTNRGFVAMVRVELADRGRTDIRIERSWIDEDEPGHPFLLRVPVGTELSVPLKAMDGFFHTRSVKYKSAQARIRRLERGEASG